MVHQYSHCLLIVRNLYSTRRSNKTVCVSLIEVFFWFDLSWFWNFLRIFFERWGKSLILLFEIVVSMATERNGNGNKVICCKIWEQFSWYSLCVDSMKMFDYITDSIPRKNKHCFVFSHAMVRMKTYFQMLWIASINWCAGLYHKIRSDRIRTKEHNDDGPYHCCSLFSNINHLVSNINNIIYSLVMIRTEWNN